MRMVVPRLLPLLQRCPAAALGAQSAVLGVEAERGLLPPLLPHLPPSPHPGGVGDQVLSPLQPIILTFEPMHLPRVLPFWGSSLLPDIMRGGSEGCFFSLLPTEAGPRSCSGAVAGNPPQPTPGYLGAECSSAGLAKPLCFSSVPPSLLGKALCSLDLSLFTCELGLGKHTSLLHSCEDGKRVGFEAP